MIGAGLVRNFVGQVNTIKAAVLAVLAASGGAALVGFIQAGVGAVARTLQSKQREWLSPEDFGVVGDGVTNDYANMQKAFTAAAAAGLPVRLGDKTYLCSGTRLEVSCDVIGSRRSIIKGYMSVNADNITLRGFRLTSTNAAYGLFTNGTSGAHRSNVTVDGVLIDFNAGVATAASLGILADYCDKLRIVNGSYVYYGVQMTGCADYLVHGSTLDGDNHANENELLHASTKSYGVISGCTFRNSLDNFIDLYTSGERTIITGNRFLSCQTRQGTAVEIKVSLTDTANTSSDATGWTEQIVITDNVFCDLKPYAQQTTSCISVYYIDSRAAPVFSWANAPRNILIANNIFDTFTPVTVSGAAAFNSYVSPILLIGVTGVVVKGNILRGYTAGASGNSASSGVWIEGCRNVIVDGNVLNVGGGSAVTIHATTTAGATVHSENITIANNQMVDDQKNGYVLAYGVRFLKEGSRPVLNASYISITGNTIKAATSSIVQFTATTTLRDSLIVGNTCYEETVLQDVSRCVITGNQFACGPTRFGALQVGSANVCAHNTITSNRLNITGGTAKPGIAATKLRASVVTGNIANAASYGMLLVGSGAAGECDNLVVKDNLSISQTLPEFPKYSTVSAGDQATIVADTNVKST